MLPQNHIYMGKWQIHATMMLPIFVSNVCIPTTPFSIAFRNAWKAMAAHMLATLGKACNIIFGSIALEISMRHFHWLLLGCRAPRHLLRSIDGCGKGTNSLWFQLESVHGAKNTQSTDSNEVVVNKSGLRWYRGMVSDGWGRTFPCQILKKIWPRQGRPFKQTHLPSEALGNYGRKKNWNEVRDGKGKKAEHFATMAIWPPQSIHDAMRNGLLQTLKICHPIWEEDPRLCEKQWVGVSDSCMPK